MKPARRIACAVTACSAAAPEAISAPQPTVPTQGSKQGYARIAVADQANAKVISPSARRASGAEIANPDQSVVQGANRTAVGSTSDRILELTLV